MRRCSFFAAGGAFGAVALAASCLGSPETPERAGIELLLTRMEQAVLAMDAEAYFACLCEDDVVFRTEQSEWAEDWTRDRPETFDLTLGEPIDADLPAHRRAFRLTMDWRVEGRGDRSISYPVLFEQPGGEGAWVYRGEHWTHLESTDGSTIVKFWPGDERLAGQITEVMPEIRRHVNAGFEVDYDTPIEIKLYDSMAHLQSSIYLSYDDPLGGWYEPGESIKVLVQGGATGDSLRPVLAHEYGHTVTFALGEKSNDMPWWVLEGVAELASQAYRPGMARQAQRMVDSWSRNGHLADFEELADYHTVPLHQHIFVYTQGYHFIGYVSDEYGRAGRNAWLTAMAKGKSIDEATREVMGIGFDELERAWRATLAQPRPQPVEAN